MNETIGWADPIKKETLEELVLLLETVYANKWRFAVDVMPLAIQRTICTEEDAQETIRRLKEAQEK